MLNKEGLFKWECPSNRKRMSVKIFTFITHLEYHQLMHERTIQVTPLHDSNQVCSDRNNHKLEVKRICLLACPNGPVRIQWSMSHLNIRV